MYKTQCKRQFHLIVFVSKSLIQITAPPFFNSYELRFVVIRNSDTFAFEVLIQLILKNSNFRASMKLLIKDDIDVV